MNIAETLIKSMGLDPAQVQAGIAQFVNEARGLKVAFNSTMANFHARLEQVERQQSETLAILRELKSIHDDRNAAISPAAYMNGKDHGNG
jgi:hypothetical protein